MAVDPNGDGALSEDTLEAAAITAAVGTPGDVLTQIVLTGLPTGSVSVQTPNTPTANWIINIEALEAFVAGLTGTNTVTFDRAAGTLTINLDPNAGLTTFDQEIFLQAPLDSDVDAEGVQIFVRAEQGAFSSEFTGPPTTIVVDAIVDGSEVTGMPANAFSSPTPAPIDLNLNLTLGNDSTTGLTPFESQGSEPNDFSDAGDETESVREVVVTLTPSDPTFGSPQLGWNTALLDVGSGVTVVTGAPGSGITTWTFDTSGLTQAQVEALVDSFAVTPAPDFFGTIGVALTTTTVEDNTPEGTVPASGQEPNLADNTDIDSYEFDVVVSQGVTGNVAVDPNGDGALSEDTLEEVNISAAVGSPANGDVLTQIVLTGLPTGSVSVQTPNTPTANWIINIEALEAFVAGLTGTNTVTFDRAAGTLTINLDPNAGVTSFDQDIFMQAPLDSDVDAEGVQISVTGQNGTEVDQFTGPPTTIVVDAIVDGSEVTGMPANAFSSPTPAPIDLNLNLTLGNDSTTGLTPFESQGSEPNDFSDAGDETESVREVVVTLTPSDPTFGSPQLGWNTALLDVGSGVTVVTGAPGSGITTWTFDTSGLTQGPGRGPGGQLCRYAGA